MNAQALINTLFTNGDSYINYISPVSGKLKYHVATIDFSKQTSPYIFNKLTLKYKVRPVLEGNQVLVFCYDIDDFKIIDVTKVISVLALNIVIKQNAT